MKRVLTIILKSLAGLIAIVLVLIGIALYVVHTDSFQQKMIQRASKELSEKLKTRVEIDSVSVSIMTQHLSLHGVDIEDQQKVKMFTMKELSIDANAWELIRHKVKIEDVKIKGIKANLYQLPDSTFNFMFVVETFKKDKTKKAKKPEDGEKKSSPILFDVDKVSLEDIDVTYNQKMHASLQSLKVSKNWLNKISAEIKGVDAHMVANTKKGPLDNDIALASLDLSFKDQQGKATLRGIHFKTDNHKPRRNDGRPKRGFFDSKHLDILADIDLNINFADKDTANVSITNCTATDSVAGLFFTNLKCEAAINKKAVTLSDFSVNMKDTKIAIKQAVLNLPNKKQNRKLSYHTSTISGQALLKDISRPFAPVLKNFTTPLSLTAEMSGNDERMTFNNVHVYSADKGINTLASGNITDLKDKNKLAVVFNVSKMNATNSSIVKVINHFSGKKLMMDELKSLGNVGFSGGFGVYWKREEFHGKLITQAGNIDFNFSLDELNKYMDGNLRTVNFKLGQMVQERYLSPISCKAKFRVDFSKERTAKIRRTKGGKLPIGTAEAFIDDINYGLIHMRNVSANLVSDGATASGNVTSLGRHTDLFCDFSYTNTTKERKTSFKPRVKLHKLSDKDRADDLKKKQLRQEEKAKKKAQKEAEKAKRKAEKEAKKAAKKAAKRN